MYYNDEEKVMDVLSTQDMEMKVVHSLKHSTFPLPVKHNVDVYCLLLIIMFQSMKSIIHFLLRDLLDCLNGYM